MSAFLDFFRSDGSAPAECIVKIGNEEISEYYHAIIAIEVQQKRKENSTATISFSINRNVSGSWAVLDDPRIRTWALIEIQAVFDEESTSLLTGYIREIKTDIPASGSASMQLLCDDIFLAMDRTCHRVTWDENMTDNAIFQEILRPHGVSLDNDSAMGLTESCHQDVSDFRFIKKRAIANGDYEFYLRETSMYFGPSRFDKKAQGLLLVQAGSSSNCLSFNLQNDGYRPDKVSSQVAATAGVDPVISNPSSEVPLFGSTAVNSSDDGLEPFVWCADTEGDNDETRSEARAQGAANEQAFRLKASGKLDATKYGGVMIAGLPVEVDGINPHSGKWYVDTVTHKVDGSGFFTDFVLLNNAQDGNVDASVDRLQGVR